MNPGDDFFAEPIVKRNSKYTIQELCNRAENLVLNYKLFDFKNLEAIVNDICRIID